MKILPLNSFQETGQKTDPGTGSTVYRPGPFFVGLSL
jgi:hypothetical protein